MIVGDLIKKLEFWNRNLPVVLENRHMFDEIKDVEKEEIFYDGETGDLLVEEEEGTPLDKITVLVIKPK